MKIKNLALTLSLLVVLISCKKEQPNKTTVLEGQAFGTSFYIKYESKKDYSKEIDSLFYLINKSLSTYIPTSDISKINKGDTTIIVDDFFKEVYIKSKRIYEETEGVFDPTIGTLVNAWGFGPEEITTKPDSSTVNELLTIVGFDKVKIVNNRVKKETKNIYFDFNAIAKGYALDIVGRLFERQKISNYLIEIGGEIRTKGINDRGTLWKAGIESPNFDGSRSVQKTVELNNESMATSGNYRKYKIDSLTGEKYAHILNPKTGYPSKNNLLSVSIIGKIDCADADGYATALMAMSLEKTKQFLKNHQELRAYIIYSDKEGNLKTYATSNF